LITAGIALAASTGPARADDRDRGDAPADEVIVIVGLRIPRVLLDVPGTVTVVDRAEIERTPQVLPDEVVRTVPSVGTFRRSSSMIADPTSQGVNVRGVGPSAASRALVLRDGIPVSDPFGGWMYWRALPLLAIDRVEIAPGGSSALFGDMALGGVIDVVSRPIAPRSVEGVLAGGSLGTGRGAVRLSDRLGEVGVAFDGELYRSAGYAPIVPELRGPIDGDAASDHQTSQLRLEHRRGVWVTHATATWFREHLDAGTQFTTADVRVASVAAGWRMERDDATLRLDVFGGDRLFRQSRARVGEERTTATLASRQETPASDQGFAVSWTERRHRHDWIVGVDARRARGTATDLLSPPMVNDDSVVERAAGGTQLSAGVFGQDVVSVTPRLDVAAALRLDAWRTAGGEQRLVRGDGSESVQAFAARDELQLDPRLSALYRVTDIVGVRASVYRAFRAPTLNELYRPFQVGTILTEANAALDPEILWGGEAGTQVVTGGMAFRATGFYNRLDGAIANVTLPEPLPSGATRRRENLGRSRIAGVELELSWRPSETWQLVVAHTFTDARVTAAPGLPDLVGKRLPQDPRDRTVATVVLEPPHLFTLTGQVRHLGRQFEDDLEMLPMAAVTLVDARIARAIAGGVSIFASAQNLLDRRYLVGRAGVDTEGAPRTFEVGLSYR
jgi:iron complex outermembrane receptor protein